MCERTVMSPAFLPPTPLPVWSAPTRSRSSIRPLTRTETAVRPQRALRSVSTASLKDRAKHTANLLKLAVVAAGSLSGAVIPGLTRPHESPVLPQAVAASASTKVAYNNNGGIPLKALGIKREDFMGERELRRRKTTQYSEAEEEIMELEEYEVETQWFRDLQVMWAGVASVGGIFVLYKGGVMWENWIKEQEKKDMEEEIELTGTFIDPRAVRKDDDDDESTDKGNPKNGKKPSGEPDGGSSDGDTGGDFSPDGGLESLEKMFGKS